MTTSLTCELAPSNQTLVTPTPVLGMCVLAFLLIEAVQGHSLEIIMCG